MSFIGRRRLYLCFFHSLQVLLLTFINCGCLSVFLSVGYIPSRLKKDVMSQLPSKCRKLIVLNPSFVTFDRSMAASHTLVSRTKVCNELMTTVSGLEMVLI